MLLDTASTREALSQWGQVDHRGRTPLRPRGGAMLAALLLPEPVQARILGAKSLVIVPLEGLPKVDFPGLVPTGWTQTLGQKLKVMVVRKIEALNEL